MKTGNQGSEVSATYPEDYPYLRDYPVHYLSSTYPSDGINRTVCVDNYETPVGLIRSAIAGFTQDQKIVDACELVATKPAVYDKRGNLLGYPGVIIAPVRYDEWSSYARHRGKGYNDSIVGYIVCNWKMSNRQANEFWINCHPQGKYIGHENALAISSGLKYIECPTHWGLPLGEWSSLVDKEINQGMTTPEERELWLEISRIISG